jgi:hypothetical protein
MAKPPDTLYWAHVDAYERCPQKGLWQYGFGQIDIGGGPGRPKPKPHDKSRHHAVMGIVIQGVLEQFYNEEMWRHREGLKERLVKMTRDRLLDELPRNYIDWKESPPHDEMEQICVSGVLGFLSTMQAHKLLGPYARSEVTLFGYADKYLALGGRADFVIRRDDTGITMIDGKNSMTKMKHVDPDQLRWYALCFALSYRKLPDRLGFVWFRFPYDEATGESGLDWVEFTRRDLRELVERAQAVRKGQRKEHFDAKPAYDVCRLCDYESVCPQRQAAREENAAKRAKSRGLTVVSDVSPEGIFELGFGRPQDGSEGG